MGCRIFLGRQGELLSPGSVWLSSTCMKALRGHCMKMRKILKMLEVPEPWNICQEELQLGSRTS